MRLDRRQILSLAARAAGLTILTACGGTAETRPPQPTGTGAPRPIAPAPPAPGTETPPSPPALPATTGVGTARPAVSVLPTSTAGAIAEMPVPQASVDLRPPNVPVPATYFGLHMHRATTTTPWPPVPFGAWRLWDAKVTWTDLEPRKGNWDFTLLDRYVAAAAQHHVDLLLPLGFTPAWASMRPIEASPYFPPGNVAGPKYIEDWRRYVSTVASRYRGRIRNYEIWNEPNLQDYWTGTTKEIVNLAREAARILRDIDPSIVIVGPSATNLQTGVAWLDEYLAAGGGIYLDAIAHHLYVFPSPPEALTPFITRVRQIMANHGVSDKPLWNSELGWSLPKVFASDAEAAGYLARAYILNWINGVQRCYWYAWDNQTWATLWLTADDEETLKPAGIAYGEIARWLGGARVASYTIDSGNTHNCELTRAGGYSARIVWNPDRELAIAAPPEWRLKYRRDLAGTRSDLPGGAPVQIGPVPVLFEQ